VIRKTEFDDFAESWAHCRIDAKGSSPGSQETRCFRRVLTEGDDFQKTRTLNPARIPGNAMKRTCGSQSDPFFSMGQPPWRARLTTRRGRQGRNAPATAGRGARMSTGNPIPAPPRCTPRRPGATGISPNCSSRTGGRQWKDGNGMTPLHFTANGDHKHLSVLLVEKGAAVNAKALNGWTPLHVAAVGAYGRSHGSRGPRRGRQRPGRWGLHAVAHDGKHQPMPQRRVRAPQKERRGRRCDGWKRHDAAAPGDSERQEEMAALLKKHGARE